jgi:hypothetical protein
MMGQLVFCIEGYDVDPLKSNSSTKCASSMELSTTHGPIGSTSDLRQDSLKTSVLCCLHTFTAFKVDGRANCAVEYDLFELVQLIAHELPFMNDMRERAGMSELEIFERTREAFLYFGLPFDAIAPRSGGGL